MIDASIVLSAPLSVSTSTMLKILLKVLFLNIFSPFSIILTILLSFGLAYVFCVMNYNTSETATFKYRRRAFTNRFFRRNRFVISVLFLIALSVNVSLGMHDIKQQSNERIAAYDKVCTIIPMQMLDNNFSDEYIKDAMTNSGCNAESLEHIKKLWQMLPKPKPPAKYFHNEYGYPMFGDA